jgi:hypothetical protein
MTFFEKYLIVVSVTSAAPFVLLLICRKYPIVARIIAL